MPMHHDETLGFFDVMKGGIEGVKRRWNGSQGQRTGEYSDSDSFDSDCHGALSEIAVCNYLGAQWVPGKPGDPDLVLNGTAYEVRCTPVETGQLYVKATDPLDWYCVLVITPRRGWTYSIRGGIWVSDARKHFAESKSKNGKPCWIVPQDKLDFFPSDWEGQPAKPAKREG